VAEGLIRRYFPELGIRAPRPQFRQKAIALNHFDSNATPHDYFGIFNAVYPLVSISIWDDWI